METVSENPRRRGRPFVFSKEERTAGAILVQGRGPRQAANMMYCIRALAIVSRAKNPKRFKWLYAFARSQRSQGDGS